MVAQDHVRQKGHGGHGGDSGTQDDILIRRRVPGKISSFYKNSRERKQNQLPFLPLTPASTYLDNSEYGGHKRLPMNKKIRKMKKAVEKQVMEEAVQVMESERFVIIVILLVICKLTTSSPQPCFSEASSHIGHIHCQC
jgi:hypothetical protein